jgi:hypothetical protein
MVGGQEVRAEEPSFNAGSGEKVRQRRVFFAPRADRVDAHAHPGQRTRRGDASHALLRRRIRSDHLQRGRGTQPSIRTRQWTFENAPHGVRRQHSRSKRRRGSARQGTEIVDPSASVAPVPAQQPLDLRHVVSLPALFEAFAHSSNELVPS